MLGVSYAEAAEWWMREQTMLDGVMTLPEEEHPQANVGTVYSEEKGTAARYNKGKPPLDLIPVYMFLEVFEDELAKHPRLMDCLCILEDFQARSADGTALLALLEYEDLVQAAEVFSYGARKYAAWNWAKGMKWSIPLGCILRHTMAILEGEETDYESGCTHWGHIVCNLIMLRHFWSFYGEGDDRPPPGAW